MIGDQLRAARLVAGLTLRETARRAKLNAGFLSQVERGHRTPSRDTIARLADVLCVADLSGSAPKPVSGGLNRDTISALSASLAAQRRLEDAAGAGPLLMPTVAQFRLVSDMVTEARGPLRPAILDVGAQWAQFAAWLHIATGDFRRAARYLDRTADWALEHGDAGMLSTVLNLRGYIAWKRGEPGAMLSLSKAAARDRTIPPGLLAMATQQRARAHAILGDSDGTDRLLDLAIEYAAAVDPVNEPPWIYFYSPVYLQLQRGRAYRLLGRHIEAAELLTTGLAALPPEMRHADWAATYRKDLAAVAA